MMLYEQAADKYYTPASNTKLFTFYASLKVLGDSMPYLRYHERPGLALIQGTGNPMFLHPDFNEDSLVLNKLYEFQDRVYYNYDNYKDKRFGPGWSWADYAYSYQVEKTPFPMYGNIVRFEADTTAEGFKSSPEFMGKVTFYDGALDQYEFPMILRPEFKNNFAYNGQAKSGDYFAYDRPMYAVNEQVAGMLSKVLERNVNDTYYTTDTTIQYETIYGPVPDTLYRKFMRSSDNFIGEQLLLLCSAKLFDGELSSAKVIDYVVDQYMQDLPDRPRWADGSGLSRYNLFTPRSIVALLDKMYKEYPQEWLFDVLPNGGKTGTIRNWYGGKGEPYVFAKTGTLSNKHCLSGYIKAKSGKVLIFSFMNNNYIGSSTPVKKEMQRMLEYIYENN